MSERNYCYDHRQYDCKVCADNILDMGIQADKEARNGIERHPGNTAHENAAWEWGRKDGGWS